MGQKKTNLFVIGAMKAGTTSFNELLSLHPSIYYSPIKEPHYFVNELPKSIYEPSRFFDLEEYFENKFPQKLHISQIKKEEHYTKLFSLADEKYTFLAEGSTCYIHASEAAQKIYDYNPNAKILLVTREPLKRAFSHFNMDAGMGRTKNSFQQEISNNLQDFQNNNLSPWSYLGMSLYYENAKRYKDLFGANFLIVPFEELIKNKDKTLDQVFSFLEIDSISLNVPHNNASSQIKYKKALYYIKKTGFKDFFSFIFPQKFRQIVFKAISTKKPNPISIDLKTELQLKNIFEKDQKLLNNLR
jgi:hypothetical protein